SPNGQQILFLGLSAGHSGLADRWHYWSTPLSGGAAEPLIVAGRFSGRKWTRAGIIQGNGQNLYRLPVDETGKAIGRPEQLINGTEIARYPAVSQNGSMVFASETERANIWGIPLDASSGKITGAPYRITDDLSRIIGVSLSPDARYLLFTSSRNGKPQIWMKD